MRPGVFLAKIQRSKLYTHTDETPPVAHLALIRLEANETIPRWVKFKNSTVLLPIVHNSEFNQDRMGLKLAYCQSCGKFINAVTTTNIETHLNTQTHLRQGVSQRPTMTNKELADMLILFVLYEGIAFSKIESVTLDPLRANLKSRKELSRLTTVYANLVREELAAILRTAPILTVCADEWTSRSQDRYLGLTVSGLFQNSTEVKHYTLDHIPVLLLSYRATSVRADLVRVLQDYGITASVNHVISDQTSVLQTHSNGIHVHAT